MADPGLKKPDLVLETLDQGLEQQIPWS